MKRLTALFLLAFPAAVAAQEQVRLPDALIGQWIAGITGFAARPDTPPATLEINADGTYAGFSGCNRISGALTFKNNRLTFAPPATTRMMCAPAAMEQEGALISALEGDFTWGRIDGDGIALSRPEGEKLRLLPATRHSDVTIRIPGAETVDRKTIRYKCAEGLLSVEYINAGPVSLAVFTTGKDFVIASSVISGSGARYMGGTYELWTKGDEATLRNAAKGPDAATVTCNVEK